jgi:hypothetical protein
MKRMVLFALTVYNQSLLAKSAATSARGIVNAFSMRIAKILCSRKEMAMETMTLRDVKANNNYIAATINHSGNVTIALRIRLSVSVAKIRVRFYSSLRRASLRPLDSLILCRAVIISQLMRKIIRMKMK